MKHKGSIDIGEWKPPLIKDDYNKARIEYCNEIEHMT